MEKVYVVTSGRRDGSWGTTNELEENIEKIFTTKEKAEAWIFEQSGLKVDEFGYVQYNESNHPHNGHDDKDYEFYNITDYDLE